HLEAADAELKEARRLDEAAVAALLGDGNEDRGRRRPVDTGYTPGEIWRRALRLRLEGGVRAEALSALTSPATLAGGLGLLGTLVWPGIGLAPRSGGARRCRRCGRPYCRRCQMTTKYPDVCSQCMHLFMLKDGVAPGVKGQELEEVARHRRGTLVGARLLS